MRWCGIRTKVMIHFKCHSPEKFTKLMYEFDMARRATKRVATSVTFLAA
jgi:hypothetical protein